MKCVKGEIRIMSLKLYNTLSKEKEEFKPREPGKVSLYVCGVTPYDYCHLGHARVYITWDVIRRYLEYRGYQVRQVQNFTDIDDKIIRKAATEGCSPVDLAQRFISGYFADMDKLGIQRAHVYPKVTEHILEIIKMVEELVAKGYAYEVEGDVYFSIDQFPQYGKLSGRTLEDMQAGARVDVDEKKRNPMDFALWKKAKEGEISWASPWGQGRPGWHIECSVMSLKYLGDNFDIHGGGADLIFPHHENEIAQSEACTGKQPFARYWVHNGFVTVNEEKMSKSLGNFSTIRQVLEKYSAEVLRFFLLSVHYRSPIDFTPDRLEEAQKGLARLKNVLERLVPFAESKGDLTKAGEEAKELLDLLTKRKEEFIQAMDDDFNTALAIATLFDLGRDLNRYANLAGPGQANLEELACALAEGNKIFKELAQVLGLALLPVESNDQSGLADSLMSLILQIRQDARTKKDWATADKIRDALKELEIVIEDSPQGAKWKRK